MRQLANCGDNADAINQASMLDLGGYLEHSAGYRHDEHGPQPRSQSALIDHLVVERALRIPGDLKLRAGRPKWLLVAAGDLPE
jgi:hypothetical protein